MSSLKNFLCSVLTLDIFNHQFFLRIGRKTKNSTNFSIILSQILIYMFLGFLAFSSINMFKKINPTINIQSFDVNSHPMIKLNKENFHFAFRLEDNDGNSLNITDYSKFFNINATFYHQHQVNRLWEVENETEFKIERCKRENFKEFKEYFETNMINSFCLTDYNFKLGGFWDEKSLSYLYITIDLCDPEIDKNCMNVQEREEILKGSYISFFIESQNVDANNYETPVKKSLKYFSYLLDLYLKKTTNFYIQQVEMNTHDSIFSRDIYQTDRFFKQNSVDFDFNLGINEYNSMNAFWEIYLYSSTNIMIIERNYDSLLQVLAYIGGITKFILMVGTFITLFYNEMKLRSILLNELFTFDKNDNEKKKESSKDEASPLKIFAAINDSSNSNKNIDKVELMQSMLNSKNLQKEKEDSLYVGQDNYKRMESLQIIEKKQKSSKFRNDLIIMSEKSDSEEIKIDLKEDYEGPKVNRSETRNDLVEMPFKNNQSPISNKNKDNPPDKRVIDEIEELEKNKGKLHFSSWEVFRSIFFPLCLSKQLKQKLKLYQHASQDLLKYINVIEIVQTLQQFEKLKMILFNKNQLVLFNYLSKPLISNKTDSERQIDLKRSEKSDTKVIKMMRYLNPSNKREQYDDILNYYNEIVNSGNPSEIDIRLFELLDDDLARTINRLYKEKKIKSLQNF